MGRKRTAGSKLHLSDALRTLVQALAREVPAQVAQMLAAERAAIGEYAAIPKGALQQDVKRTTTAHARLWYESLLAGRPPSAAALEPFVEVGRHRQRQGFVLPSLLHAIRLAAIVLWEALLARAGKNPALSLELLKVSPYLLQHFDLISQAVSQGYMDELRRSARWREQLKHELGSLLFSQPENRARFHELMRSLDHDANAPYAALALRPASGDLADGDDTRLAQAAAALGIAPTALISTTRHGVLLLWLPAPAGESLVVQERELAQRAQALAAGIPVGAIGLGLPGTGPLGWRESADQALQALEIGAETGRRAAVLRYADLAIDDAVRSSRGLSRYLESLLERLASEPALIETLEAFFERRQHRKACAAALGVHINTLSHRLERIEQLLGARLDDPSWLARLHAALHLRPRVRGINRARNA